MQNKIYLPSFVQPASLIQLLHESVIHVSLHMKLEHCGINVFMFFGDVMLYIVQLLDMLQSPQMLTPVYTTKTLRNHDIILSITLGDRRRKVPFAYSYTWLT